MKAGINIAIDRGGTFTDCIATDIPGREDIVVKLLSVDPSNYDDAPTVSFARASKISRYSLSIGRNKKNSRASYRPEAFQRRAH
jgi:N-methylhydantoinase A/oxoprolinase/acetone carboxylase beta subunit